MRQKVTLCGLETDKRVFLQTVKTQMKCRISSESALFVKTKSIVVNRNTIVF